MERRAELSDFFLVSLFSYPFFFHRSRTKKRKKFEISSGKWTSFPVPDFPNWKEKWWREKKGERERDRESFHSGTSIHRAKGRGRVERVADKS